LNVYAAAAAHDPQPIERRFPLALLVAGSGGNRYTHSRLAEGLARSNYWVIAPEFSGTPNTWNALAQQAHIVDALLAGLTSSDLSSLLDGQDPVYIGHSIGATLGVLLAGARPDCRGGRWDVEPASWSFQTNTKLSALVLLDPALGDAFSRKALQAVQLPAAVFVSGLEDVDLFGQANHYRNYLPNVRLGHTFPDAGHFAYCNPCSPLLARIAPRVCADERIDRAVVHRQLLHHLDNFLAVAA
jgi:pimeloyl-ACP methyl ester carboxylesterase